MKKLIGIIFAGLTFLAVSPSHAALQLIHESTGSNTQNARVATSTGSFNVLLGTTATLGTATITNSTISSSTITNATITNAQVTNVTNSSTTFTATGGTVTVNGRLSVGGTLAVTGATTHTGAVTNSSNTATTGFSTIAGQPGFMATSTGTVNVTGDGTAYTVVYLTQVNDVGGDNYNPNTGIYTAPVTGYYSCSAGINTDQTTVGAGHGIGTFKIVSTGGSYGMKWNNAAALGNIQGDRVPYWASANHIAMTAGDTIKVVFTVSSGTKIIDIENDATLNYFGCTLNN